MATVEEDTERHTDEMIAMHLLTLRGERPLVPLFGVEDAAFTEPTSADLQASLSVFGPDVSLAEFDVEYANDRVAVVTVAYE